MVRMFVFPGQGSQLVGMGKKWHQTFPVAKNVFQEIDDVLEQNLSELIFHGNIEELTLTENAQPAIMAVSVAIARVIEAELAGNPCKYLAGHSLGEYSALCTAGSLTIAETAHLLKARGRAMQEAVKPGIGSMVALLGTNIERITECLNKVDLQGVCQIANDNGGGQVIVSGNKFAVEEFLSYLRNNGIIKRAVNLPVSAPFHCDLMRSAAKIMASKLNKVDLLDPSVPLISNVTADVVTQGYTIKNLLVQQIYSTVRWQDSIIRAIELGVKEFYEIGPGRVLTNLIKRINSNVKVCSIEIPHDLDKVVSLCLHS